MIIDNELEEKFIVCCDNQIKHKNNGKDKNINLCQLETYARLRLH